MTVIILITIVLRPNIAELKTACGMSSKEKAMVVGQCDKELLRKTGIQMSEELAGLGNFCQTLGTHINLPR